MTINIIVLPVILLFMANGVLHLYYSIHLRRKFPKNHNSLNSIIIVVLWIIAGMTYPFLYPDNTPQIKWFQGLSTTIICILTPGMILIILLYESFIVKKNPQIKKNRERIIDPDKFNQMKIDQRNSGQLSLKIDIHRKLLHLFPVLMILFLWIFATQIWEGMLHQDELWGISGIDYAKFLILTVGFSGIMVFAILDYLRLSFIFDKGNLTYLVPDNVTNLLNKSMKANENFEFLRPASLVLSFEPIFFLPFEIFAATVLIATIGDGAASVFGLKFGNCHVDKNNNKTIIGHLAGFGVSFLISVLALIVFSPSLNLIKISFIALIGALTFLVIDILSLKIDDNILNPLACGILMWISSLLFF